MTWSGHAKLVLGLALGLVLISPAISKPVEAAQCAPYARHISGIDLYGNAWTWWQAASGQYSRGRKPEVGAALVFKRSRHMPAGHVAVVTAVVNDRVIKVSHANWAPKHGGPKGRVQTDIEVVDESPNNDWSEVRVWYPPVHDFGLKTYPVYGFIYPDGIAENSDS